MPVYCCIDPDKNLITFISRGVITAEQITKAREVVLCSDKFTPDMDLLSISLEVTDINLTADQVKELATRDITLSDNSKRVLVAPLGMHYGMARMYQINHEFDHPNKSNIKIVTNLTEAWALLNH